MGDTDVDKEKFGNGLREVIERITNMQANVVVSASPDGNMVAAQLNVDERETTELVLQIVAVAENNGLKLPREFGLLLKQSLYFDRYLKLLAPDLDPLRDERVSEAYGASASAGNERKKVIIDAEVIE